MQRIISVSLGSSVALTTRVSRETECATAFRTAWMAPMKRKCSVSYFAVKAHAESARRFIISPQCTHVGSKLCQSCLTALIDDYTDQSGKKMFTVRLHQASATTLR